MTGTHHLTLGNNQWIIALMAGAIPIFFHLGIFISSRLMTLICMYHHWEGESTRCDPELNYIHWFSSAPLIHVGILINKEQLDRRSGARLEGRKGERCSSSPREGTRTFDRATPGAGICPVSPTADSMLAPCPPPLSAHSDSQALPYQTRCSACTHLRVSLAPGHT